MRDRISSRHPETGKNIRDTYKYVLKRGNHILYVGITNDLMRRELEHRQIFPTARLEKVGRRTTREGALKWERKQISHGILGSNQVRQAARFAVGLNKEALKELKNH